MSYNSLFRKAGRIFKSYLISLDREDVSETEKKRRIFEDYIRQESQSRSNSNKSSAGSQRTENTNRGNYSNTNSNTNYNTNSNANSNPNRRETKNDAFYYSVLGLKPGVSVEEIKKTYKILMSQYHPDKVANLGPELQELAKKKTQEFNEAYSYFKKAKNF